MFKAATFTEHKSSRHPKITVEIHHPSGTTYKIEVSPLYNVSQLKQKIYKITGIAFPEQHLLSSNYEMRNNDFLIDYLDQHSLESQRALKTFDLELSDESTQSF